MQIMAEPVTECSTEFALAAACCAWPLTDERLQAIRGRSVSVDWALFAKAANLHRIEGLVWHALDKAGVDLPEPIRISLRNKAAGIARDNLLSAVESRRLAEAFSTAQVPLIFVKGLTLAVLAYESLALKKAIDIDLVVPSGHIAEAGEILTAAGYSVRKPRALSSLVSWHGHLKESVWVHPEKMFHVDLHTRLVDNPLLLQGVDPEAPARLVQVAPGISLPTLGEDALFSYLCVHGASSAWFRLKWLADVAALISHAPGAAVEDLYDRAHRLGAARAAGQALLLCRDVFGMRLPEGPVLAAEADPVVRWLCRSALRQMEAQCREEAMDRRFGTVLIHLTQFALRPGYQFKLAELKRQLASKVAVATMAR